MPPPPPRRRPGLTLTEVLVALAIFLLAIVAVGALISQSSDNAARVNDRSRAARVCQSKMAEFQCGSLPLESVDEQPVDDDDTGLLWSATVDSAPSGLTNLYQVQVTVSRETPDGGKTTLCTLTKLVLDPSAFGSAQDVPPSPLSSTSTGAAGSGATGSTTPATGSTTPAATTPAATPPRTTTPTTKTGG
jgi:general secretion pathway protein I